MSSCKDFLVLLDETVFEHALRLVQLQLGDLVLLAAVEVRLRLQQPIDRARHVAQVELVEELARGRTQLGFYQDRLEDAVERVDTVVGYAR